MKNLLRIALGLIVVASTSAMADSVYCSINDGFSKYGFGGSLSKRSAFFPAYGHKAREDAVNNVYKEEGSWLRIGGSHPGKVRPNEVPSGLFSCDDE
jgi:hypothetical protein